MRGLRIVALLFAIVAAAAIGSAAACGSSDDTAGDGGGGGEDGGGGGEDGGGGGEDGGGGNPVPASEMCNKVTDWFCGMLVKCFPGMQAGDCGKLLLLECADFTIDPAKVDYDEVKAGECFVKMNELACEGNPDEIPICKEAIIGKVAADGECSTDFDCVEGLMCDYEDVNSCGKCVAEVAENGDCSDAPCETGLYCDESDKCVPMPGLGDACDTGDGAVPCVEQGLFGGLWCKPDSEGATTGECTKKGAEGDSCESDEECAIFYLCDGGTCALKPRTGEACSFEKVEGEFSQGQYMNCLYLGFLGGEYCKEGATEGEGTCEPLPGKDGDCGGTDNPFLCAPDLWCSDMAQGGTCQDKGAEDDPCNPDFDGMDCMSGVCKGDGATGVCEGTECR
ncbi:MAG: hypothetical protein HY897_09775 [Deltaproteobacteria bacterium]|nr:hypothetical protein [Deltaproteobacteria bacterium]